MPKEGERFLLSLCVGHKVIKGGYILQPRKVDNSDLMKAPPVVRELWLYLLRKVNWKDNGVCIRGEGFFRFEDIQNDLCWYVGYRKMMYSKPQLTKSLRRLREGNAIATTKETRGVRVTVLKYDFYQDKSNYEGNDEEPMKKARRKSQGSTILKESTIQEEEKEKTILISDEKTDVVVVFDYWKNKTGHVKANLDDKRKRLISARLKDGYSADDLKAAIDGCMVSPFHQGKNDTGAIHDGIDLICRSAEKVDAFMGTKNNGNTATPTPAPQPLPTCKGCIMPECDPTRKALGRGCHLWRDE